MSQVSNLSLPLDPPPPAPPNPFTGGKLDRELALLLAQRYIHLLEPVCERIEIAGSIRRLKPLVKDIELVVIEKHKGSCFEVLMDYRSKSKIAPHDFWIRKGERYLHFRDLRTLPPLRGGREGDGGILSVPVDLFISQPEYWGWTFFIRTGEGLGWNRACMAHLHSLGYRIEHNKIWSPSVHGGIKGGFFQPLREEQDIFDLLGIPFVPPHQRCDANSLNLALYNATQSGQYRPR